MSHKVLGELVLVNTSPGDFGYHFHTKFTPLKNVLRIFFLLVSSQFKFKGSRKFLWGSRVIIIGSLGEVNRDRSAYPNRGSERDVPPGGEEE